MEGRIFKILGRGDAQHAHQLIDAASGKQERAQRQRKRQRHSSS
jgi:hypothetical protein